MLSAKSPTRTNILLLRGLINVFYFSENSEYFYILENKRPPNISEKNNFLELEISY